MSRLAPWLLSLCSSGLFLLVVCSRATAQDAPLRWFTVSSPETAAAGWFRWALDGSVHPADEARLTFSSAVPCSLYINGQRLLRMEALQTPAGAPGGRTWDISSLLRSGRNLVAVELQSPEKSGAFAASLSVRRGDRWTAVGGPWKTAPAPPPAGWQQTDFNDRDWKEVPSAQRPEGLAAPQIPERIEAPIVAARVRNELPFVFEDGDHICLVGATFIERAQLFEHLEAVLAGAAGKRRVTFRNLGWAADTVFAESRGIFDAPSAGYLRMVEQVRAEEPSVVFVCYGQNEALTAGMSPENFARQMGQFLDELAASGIPCVLVSPHELLPAPPPIPSPARFNRRIQVYAESVSSVAQSRKLAFVDLFTDFSSQLLSNRTLLRPFDPVPAGPSAFAELADNGMHLTDSGYASAALLFRQRLLELPAMLPTVRIDAEKRSVIATGAEIQQLEWLADGQVTFSLRQSQLSPIPVALEVAGAGLVMPDSAPGTAPAGTPADPLVPTTAAADGRARIAGSTLPYEHLRELIRSKNELYFHRWRPQNITYLFGFRKHEQGNNAADIARFDPFVRDLEAKIHAAQLPPAQTVRVQLTKAKAP
ncbi:MAG: GDSL-type esterase/lipase family protein [Planctomycetota bacterium]